MTEHDFDSSIVISKEVLAVAVATPFLFDLFFCLVINGLTSPKNQVARASQMKRVSDLP